MIYLDTSVALAQLLAKDRCPPPELWEETVVTSRLLEYELWNAIHRHGLEGSHADAVRVFLESLAFAELSRDTIHRATEGFPTPVRTLDALHLSTLMFLREQGLDIALASYDERMNEAAAALGVSLVEC